MEIAHQFRRNAIRIALNGAVLCLFLVHSAGLLPLPLVNLLESYAYDARMLVSTQAGTDPRIVIVDIDEQSLARDGRWPWSRDKMAQLLDNLFEQYHAALVGFDVLFAEPDTSSGYATLYALSQGELSGDSALREQLGRLRERLDFDGLFARSMSG